MYFCAVNGQFRYAMEEAEKQIRDELKAANAAWTDRGREELYKEYFVLPPNGVTFFTVSFFVVWKIISSSFVHTFVSHS